MGMLRHHCFELVYDF